MCVCFNWKNWLPRKIHYWKWSRKYFFKNLEYGFQIAFQWFLTPCLHALVSSPPTLIRLACVTNKDTVDTLEWDFRHALSWFIYPGRISWYSPSPKERPTRRYWDLLPTASTSLPAVWVSHFRMDPSDAVKPSVTALVNILTATCSPHQRTQSRATQPKLLLNYRLYMK